MLLQKIFCAQGHNDGNRPGALEVDADDQNAAAGMYPICQTATRPDNPASIAGTTWSVDVPVEGSRFVVVRRELSKRSAESYCQERYANLASIHGYDEQRAVVAGCKLADLSHTWQLEGSGMSGTWFSGKTNEDGTPQQVEGRANGCWIGMHDGQAEGSFAWMDGSNVDFVAWAPFQPDRAGWEEDAVSVIRTIIAGIWIAFFQECQQ